jgi:hypothetical protein
MVVFMEDTQGLDFGYQRPRTRNLLLLSSLKPISMNQIRGTKCGDAHGNRGVVLESCISLPAEIALGKPIRTDKW